MSLSKAITALCFGVLATAIPALGQTSTWTYMSAVGDWWSWDPNIKNMALVSNDTWAGTYFIKAMPLNRYKFVANADWRNPSWGESNQVTFTAPIGGFAERVTGSGHDIHQSNLVSGFYKILFNDQTTWYTIDLIQAMEANYGFMAVVGDMNGWSTEPNMTLVSNYTWQAELFVNRTSTGTNKFKFVAHNTWSLNWGENNQTIFTNPLSGTAEVSGGDILGKNLTNGIYRFTFNDSNLSYRIEFVRSAVASNGTMSLAGNFNGWSVTPNMQLVTDYVWQTTVDFANQGDIWFKFVGNGTWSRSWGETDQTLYYTPIMGTGEVVSGTGNDIRMFGYLNGRYYFRFNDKTRYYEVIPEGIVETFNNWPSRFQYGDYTNNGWIVGNGRIYSDNSRFGLCVILSTNYLEPTYLRTPLLTNGVESFSFWYRNWWADSRPLAYDFQKSTDGTNWTTFDTLTNIIETSYTRYTNNLSETNAIYLRFYHTNGGERLLIDDFHIQERTARASLSDVTLVPTAPWSNDTVTVSAMVVTNRPATGLVVRTYYRVGSTGTYTAITMTGPTNWLTTTSAIPAKPIGSIVYYYVMATFGGPGNNSPLYWPEYGPENPAWYGIARTRHGKVWVNEINAESTWFDPETNEFVELCGVSQSDIGGWTIQLFDSVNVLYAAYSLAGNTILPNDDSGFGFYVLGNSNTLHVNMPFNHTPDAQGYLKSSGGVKLLNELDVVQFALGYGEFGTNLYGFSCIGLENWALVDDGLALTGSGSNYTSFTWTTNDVFSPGEINFAQFLTGGNEDPMPELTEADFVLCRARSNVVLYVWGTNGWSVTPYYSASLTNQWPGQWAPISPHYSSYANGTNMVWFDYPSTTSRLFFRVMTTRSW